MFKTLGIFCLGLSIALQGVALFNDPWVQEEYERSVRETGRLRNEVIRFVDTFIFFEHGLALLMILAGFTVMNQYHFNYELG